jgi:hypothetical protein
MYQNIKINYRDAPTATERDSITIYWWSTLIGIWQELQTFSQIPLAFLSLPEEIRTVFLIFANSVFLSADFAKNFIKICLCLNYVKSKIATKTIILRNSDCGLICRRGCLTRNCEAPCTPRHGVFLPAGQTGKAGYASAWGWSRLGDFRP